MDDYQYPITDEMVMTELAILREYILSDEEEIQRSNDLDELFEQDLRDEILIDRWEEDGDSIESLGLYGAFGS